MFQKIDHLIYHNDPMMGYGAAVTDFDHDGQFEIFVTGFGSPNKILKWQGGGLVDVAPGLLADFGRQGLGVAAGDLTGNGREEIYLLNSDTFAGPKNFADRLFVYTRGAWEDLFARPESRSLANRTAGRSVAVLDRTGSGLYGFFTANYGGPMRLYEMDQDAQLIDAAADAGLNRVAGGRSVLSLQLVSNRMDLFVGNEGGPNFMFVNMGDGTFREAADEFGLQDAGQHARGIAVMDVNGNGLFDLVCGNWEGSHRIYLQDESGIFQDQAPPIIAHQSRVRNVIIADFDNDGYEEIFFNNIGQSNRLYRFRDSVWQELECGAAAEPAGLGTGAVVGDFDEDGQLELLVVHGESGFQPLSMYKAQAMSTRWIRILPMTRFGAPARGASVTLVCDQQTQRRAIDAGSAYLCQMEPVAHFGLQSDWNIERAIIRWPGGEIKVVESPRPNQVHKISFPENQGSVRE